MYWIKLNGFILKFVTFRLRIYFFKLITLAKVTDWNSFRINKNYSDSFRYLYPSQCELFRSNPKNVLYLVWWKTVKNQSDLIRLIPKDQSEPIRNQVFNPDKSELRLIQTEFSIRINPNESKVGLTRIDLDWKLGFGLVRIHSDWCLGINRIKSDWFLKVFYQTRYKTFFRLVRNDSHWLRYRYRNSSDWLGMNFYPILLPEQLLDPINIFQIN